MHPMDEDGQDCASSSFESLSPMAQNPLRKLSGSRPNRGDLACRVSRRVITVMKILPGPLRMAYYRIYNKLLKICAGKVHIAGTYFGSDILCDLDDYIQNCIFYFGVWEPVISFVMEQFLEEGDVFIDVGANVGYDSFLASNRVGHSGKVVSIEASPKIYALLSKNISINQTANIRAVNIAASDTRKILTLYTADQFNIGETTTIEARGLRKDGVIQALPLAEILSIDEMSRVRLIKMDIEGAEVPVLNHLIDNLAKYPDDFSIIVEASVEENPQEWIQVFSRFQEAGFAAYALENDYAFDWYLFYRSHPSIKLLDALPNTQTDLLLTRTELPVALRS